MSRPRSDRAGSLEETPANLPDLFGTGTKDGPGSLTGALSFTQEQLDEWDSQAVEWQGNPELLHTHLAHSLLVHIQALDYIVRNPPEGRSGVAAVMVAHREWRASADLLIESLLKKREGGNEAPGAKKPSR